MKGRIFLSIILVIIFSAASWMYDIGGEGIISGKAGALQAENSDAAYLASKAITNGELIRTSINWGISLLLIVVWFSPVATFVRRELCPDTEKKRE